MPRAPDPEVSDEILEEGSYYLSQLGLTDAQIAEHFETTSATVKKFVKSYGAKLRSGEVTAGDFDKVFWEDVKKEAEGNVKVTFVSDKGFHHSWKSELEKLDGEFNVADAAVAGLDVGVAGPRPAGLVLDAALEGLDLVDLGEAEIFAVDEGLDGAQEFLAEPRIAGDRPHLDERLPFPGAAERVIVGERAGQRARQRAAVPFRP